MLKYIIMKNYNEKNVKDVSTKEVSCFISTYNLGFTS